jgi:hypothetical protein
MVMRDVRVQNGEGVRTGREEERRRWVDDEYMITRRT